MTMPPTMVARTAVERIRRTNNAEVTLAVVGWSVVARRVAAVIRGCVAVVAVIVVGRRAVVAVTRSISIGAGGQAADYGGSN